MTLVVLCSAEFPSPTLKILRPFLLLLHFPKNPQHKQSGICIKIALLEVQVIQKVLCLKVTFSEE